MSLKEVRKIYETGQNNDPDTNMLNLMEVLGRGVIIPDPDKYYVFVYKAKTPGVVYDSNPLVQVTGIYKWGFTGFNFHWKAARRYTWQETVSNLYEVSEAEMPYVLRIPFANIK